MTIHFVMIERRDRISKWKKSLFALVLAAMFLGALSAWHFYINFIPSAAGFATGVLATLVAAYILLRTAFREAYDVLFPKWQYTIQLYVLLMLILSAFMYPLLGAVIPALYSRQAGEAIYFETKIEKKTLHRRGCRYYIRIPETSSIYTPNICLLRNELERGGTWESLSEGDTIQISGKKTVLGIYVETLAKGS